MRPILFVIWFLAAGAIWQVSKAIWQPTPTARLGYELDRSLVADNRSEAELYAQVNEAWDRIERLLPDIAPQNLLDLRPGASQQQIMKLESALGHALPLDLKASLLRHDGTVEYFGVFRLLGVDEIIQEREEQIREFAGDQFCDADYVLKHDCGRWDPSALTVGLAYFDLLIDLETKETRILDRMNYSGEHHDSFADSLTYIAEQLEAGNFELSKPKAKAGTERFMLQGWACPHY